MTMKKILVTGSAGFIGFHLSKKLCELGYDVVGVDNLNEYYDVTLKHARLDILKKYPNFSFVKADISHLEKMQEVWKNHGPFTRVVNLAAQAGVRYSLVDPYPYITSNVMGFTVILELCRHQEGFENLVYASTSSVYGTNKDMPFTEDQRVDHPISLYAATKRGNELMAQSYHHLFQLPTTGLRFFTVYGPWGRPDMSAFKFIKAILADEPIDVYNHGQMARDYTFVSDIVEGITKALFSTPKSNETGHHPIYNLANKQKVSLMEFIETLEKAIGKTAVKNLLPMQLGDVKETLASIEKAQKELGYQPNVSVSVGLQAFVDWYLSYYS